MRSSLIVLALGTLVAACVADPGGASPDGGSGSGSAGTGGAGVTGSGGGGSSGVGGASGSGSGGSTGVGGGGVAGNAGAGGGFDDGKLFGDAAVGLGGASGASGDAGAPQDGPVSEGGSVIPGDGNVAISTIRGAITGTAEFTQRGIDVTVVIKLTNCPMGNHAIRIHGGFSCDNVSTQGGIWDGKRGDSIGGPTSVIACTAARTGMLTYTRPGANPALNWTVADHNISTDVSAHVLIVSDVANPTTREGCGNFF